MDTLRKCGPNRRLSTEEMETEKIESCLMESKSRIAAEILGLSLGQYLVLIGESETKMDRETLVHTCAAIVGIGSSIGKYTEYNDIEACVKENIEKARLADPRFNAFIQDIRINKYIEGEMSEIGKRKFELELKNNPELQREVGECRKGKELEQEILVEAILLKMRKKSVRVMYS